MFKTIKENGYLVVRMIVMQLGMTFFGLVVSMAVVKNNILFPIVSIFSVLFYLVLLFTITNEIGLKDQIRIESGRMAPQPLKCLWLSLAANSFNLLLGILVIFGKLFINIGFFEKYSEDVIYSPTWAINLSGIAQTLASFIQAMYAGVVKLYMSGNPLAYIIIVIPAILVSTYGYILGIKGFVGIFTGEKKKKD